MFVKDGGISEPRQCCRYGLIVYNVNFFKSRLKS